MASCSCTRPVPAADIVVVVTAAMVVLADMAAEHTVAVGDMVDVEGTAAVEDTDCVDRRDSAERMAEQIALVASRDFQQPRPQIPPS
jgi:hypothetical protein